MPPTAPDLSDVAIIGAGGAGLLAGIAASGAGASTIVYERMAKPGKKVAISGGGRCNFTNSLEPRDFVRLFGDPNASRLGHALRAFSRDDLIGLLGKHGIYGQIEKGYRLYTKSGRGFEVVEALVEELRASGGTLAVSSMIVDLRRSLETGLYELAGEFGGSAWIHRAKAVVVTTGGLSYPATGSTGDGYRWAKEFGHGVTELRAALVGLSVVEDWPRKLQGLACPDVEVRLWPDPGSEGSGVSGDSAAAARKARKPLALERAEILFTHFGISGPAILDISNTFVGSGLLRGILEIDFLPGLDPRNLDDLLLDRSRKHPNRSIARALEGLLPARLLERFEAAVDPEGKATAGHLSREARRLLLDLLKGTILHASGTRRIEYGEVTAGGVEWKDIDPATLESRLSPGLFFAGEILDVTGRCGGFNLQAAFSTGYLAGLSAARRALGSAKSSASA